MIAADSSVVVAAFASWHEGHAAAAAVLARGPRLPAHVALEVFSVLTRLPPPHRTTAALALSFLENRFRGPFLILPAREHLRLLRKAAETGITGGAVYDALVAATAKHAGAILLTRDRRAAQTYEALGVRYEFAR